MKNESSVIILSAMKIGRHSHGEKPVWKGMSQICRYVQAVQAAHEEEEEKPVRKGVSQICSYLEAVQAALEQRL